MLNYYEIGQRIRTIRKAHRLSQEELADRVGISVTHMSHIETGNTKLSLSVLVELAAVLEVHTDELIFDTYPENGYMAAEFSGLLSECTPRETRILYDILKAAKTSLHKNR